MLRGGSPSLEAEIASQRLVELASWVERERFEEETWFDALTRVVIEAAVASYGSQREVHRQLGVATKTIYNHLQRGKVLREMEARRPKPRTERVVIEIEPAEEVA